MCQLKGVKSLLFKFFIKLLILHPVLSVAVKIYDSVISCTSLWRADFSFPAHHSINSYFNWIELSFSFFLLRKPICAHRGNNYPTFSLKNLLEQSLGKVKSQAGLAFQEGGQLFTLKCHAIQQICKVYF